MEAGIKISDLISADSEKKIRFLIKCFAWKFFIIKDNNFDV